MCLAIYKPAKIEIPEDHIFRAEQSNPDGMGLAWVQNNRLHIKKGIWCPYEFNEIVQEIAEFQAIIHFRYATAGQVDDVNCHPFKYRNVAMVHNGILPHFSGCDRYSDTYHFFESIKHRNPFNAKLKAKIEREIGRNKLIFLNAKGQASIYNESQGYWEGGAWYSNECCFYATPDPDDDGFDPYGDEFPSIKVGGWWVPATF
jgi:predicted glutamine amidotransferase